jgi:hypothetical protein
MYFLACPLVLQPPVRLTRRDILLFTHFLRDSSLSNKVIVIHALA